MGRAGIEDCRNSAHMGKGELVLFTSPVITSSSFAISDLDDDIEDMSSLTLGIPSSLAMFSSRYHKPVEFSPSPVESAKSRLRYDEVGGWRRRD